MKVAPQYAGKYETGAMAPAVKHMAFLDGLRGLTALYVVINHCVRSGFAGLAPPRWTAIFGWGHAAVTVFIVISGFCLGLPVVRSDRKLRGGAVHFYKRRAYRILPTYYAAILLGIAINILTDPTSQPWGILRDPLFGKALFVHILLIHNWFHELSGFFDGPAWSIAVECQIYALFPLILLFWRKFGTASVLAASFVFAHGLNAITHRQGSANYLFEFVLGAWGADLIANRNSHKYLRWSCYAAFALFLLSPVKFSAESDLLVGLGTSALLVLCASTPFWPRRILSFAPLAWFGSFSYSIYMVHGIALGGYLDFRSGHPQSALASPVAGYPLLAMLSLVIVPLALAAAWVFHLAVERPFMSTHKVRLAVPGEGVADMLVKPL